MSNYDVDYTVPVDYVELRKKAKQQCKDTLDLHDKAAGHPVAEAELEYLEARCEQAEAEAQKWRRRCEKLANFNPDWDMLESTREVLEEHKRTIGRCSDRIEADQVRRAELSARVERLRQALNQATTSMQDSGYSNKHAAVLACRQALDETNASSLAHVRADAIEHAVEVVEAKLARLGKPSEAQNEGICCTLLEFRVHASGVRQSANQSGEDDGE